MGGGHAGITLRDSRSALLRFWPHSGRLAQAISPPEPDAISSAGPVHSATSLAFSFSPDPGRGALLQRSCESSAPSNLQHQCLACLFTRPCAFSAARPQLSETPAVNVALWGQDDGKSSVCDLLPKRNSPAPHGESEFHGQPNWTSGHLSQNDAPIVGGMGD